VKTVQEAKTIIGLGVEKVALSAAVLENPDLVTAIAEEVGSQSLVVVLDVKRTGETYAIWTHNATRNTGRCPVEFSRKLQAAGVGEIVLNSIDHDGEMKGYDLQIAGRVREAVTVPMSVLGGAGSLTDVGSLIQRFGIIGAVAGSLFVFKGVYKAVLINYPNPTIKDQLIRDSLAGLSSNAAP